MGEKLWIFESYLKEDVFRRARMGQTRFARSRDLTAALSAHG
jgi:hypothetical protein